MTEKKKNPTKKRTRNPNPPKNIPINQILKRNEEQLKKMAPKLQEAAVDQEQINKLANHCITWLFNDMQKSRTTAQQKRMIALEITKKVVPKDLVISNGEKGNSFISLIKELHEKEG